ncbi:MAG: hydroxyacid aldolase [Rhizobiales bacterium 65-9]|nr:hydroxyacid aldolase [Hyphomicrobiales bacterium]OJY37381.1 MAG: hydroxyacid aldolase [Rhizobiales bacterium 65-9]
MPSPIAALPDLLKAGKPIWLGWCGMTDPLIPGLMARAGFDAVLLDQQHGFHDFASSLAGVSEVTLAGKPCLGRIAVGDFAMASRLLDAGAAGVVAPMINTVADARLFASFAKLPPIGERSWGPSRALALSGLSMPDYLKSANDFTLAIAMCETKEAMAALDDIMAVPGIDGVLTGPSDISVALSDGATIDGGSDLVFNAMADIGRRVRKAGKVACAYGASPQRARQLVEAGYQIVCIQNDQQLVRAGFEAALKAAKG